MPITKGDAADKSLLHQNHRCEGAQRSESDWNDSMQKKVKQVWNIITSVLIGLVVLLAFALWGVRIFGLEGLVVQSGSMEPAYPVGSLVYVKETDPSGLEVGDVITFRSAGEVLCTHRIAEVLEENGSRCFITKGDNNDAADSNPVLPRNLVGKVVWMIPGLGYFAAYIQNPPGLYIAVCAAAVLLLLTILPDLIFPEDKDEKKQEEAQ